MTDFLNLLVSGVALGAQYSLVALGFVVIYRATGVINFAQGGFCVLGAFLAYNFHNTWGVPFYLALVLTALAGAGVGALVDVTVLRRFVGQSPFVVIMLTIGLLILIQQVVPSVWGADPLPLGDPWGLRTVSPGGVDIKVSDLWTVGIVAVVLVAFFAFFRFSRMGVAMRATAVDLEAAMAQGIPAHRVYRVSWSIAGLVAALAGLTLAAGGGGVRLDIELVALTAFPVIILGGLDSPGGAVAGGLLIGVAQVMSGKYQPEHATWLGQGFPIVMPYVVMIIVLLVRPYGLFGQRKVRRI